MSDKIMYAIFEEKIFCVCLQHDTIIMGYISEKVYLV
jgi:hypothetical protein